MSMFGYWIAAAGTQDAQSRRETSSSSVEGRFSHKDKDAVFVVV